MASDILHELNEIFLHKFPGKWNGEPRIITRDKSRFHNQPQILTPEFDNDTTKFILGYPDRLYRLSQ